VERVGNAVKVAVDKADRTNWRREFGLAWDIVTPPWVSTGETLKIGHLAFHRVVGARVFILDIDSEKNKETNQVSTCRFWPS
jgi:hypothetical protein